MMMPIPLPKNYRVARTVLISGSLMVLVASLAVGFNIGYDAGSPAEAGLNDSMRDQMLGENRQLEEFPDENKTVVDADRPVGGVFGELVISAILLPTLERAVGIIDWSAGVAYQYQHLPVIVLQAPLIALVAVAGGLPTFEIARLFGVLNR